MAKTNKKDCIEWNADGSCAKYRYSDEEGNVMDLTACSVKEKEKLLKELKRGFKVVE
ncbi:unnamed protein product [marine sediment metagenome]|uniref:Uncharacterized protein n=1 Tax=marine sediment metagenome TaxID=412755 RepID=X1J8H9_9ZZZZ